MQTLLDVAQAVDVALLVQFVSYPDFLERMRDKSPAGMVPENITESTHRVNTAVATEALLRTPEQEPQTALRSDRENLSPQRNLASSAKNREKLFNSTGSALMQTGTDIKRNNRQTIQ